MDEDLPDIKPVTSLSGLELADIPDTDFWVDNVAVVAGMSPAFINKVVWHREPMIDREELWQILCQDVYSETFVPKSLIPQYLVQQKNRKPSPIKPNEVVLDDSQDVGLWQGNALELINRLPESYINCVVTSPPYWGVRIYEDSQTVKWGDGDIAVYGHEQNPEAYIRHTTEIVAALGRVLTSDGSIWLNVSDTYMTRAPIRGSASEIVEAMNGSKRIGWKDHRARRYSAGHSYLSDGELCQIPLRIAERVSRLGLYLKSVVVWNKTSTTPDPQNSRVARNWETVLHIAKQRTPKFDRGRYNTVEPEYGGRGKNEPEVVNDVWTLNTTTGRGGHGAQFPVALPGRCIALSTAPGDVVLDPFVGLGNTGIAALAHGCRFIGFDISGSYLDKTRSRLEA